MGTSGYRRATTVWFQPGWVIVEVGFERDSGGEGSGGEDEGGSTTFLAGVGPPVHVFDVDPAQVQRARELDAGRGIITAHLGRAEDALRGWQLPVGFAWLDGHDWPYQHAPVGTWDAQEREYLARGQEYSREASRASHLEVARLLQPHVPVGGVVAFDDTWELPSPLDPTPGPALTGAQALTGERAWNGKGGAAVDYLLRCGFEVVETGDIYHGLTVTRRTSK